MLNIHTVLEKFKLRPIIEESALSSFDEINKKVRQLHRSGKVEFSRKHIEEDRAYREIYVVDVEEVLRNGKVVQVDVDQSFRWSGVDSDEREIQLVCRMLDNGGNDTLEVLTAEQLSIETAYEKGTKNIDEKIRDEWLEKKKDWRLKDNGCVERIRK